MNRVMEFFHDLESTDLAGAAYLAGEARAWHDYEPDEPEPLTDCPWCGEPLVTEGPHAGECPNHGPLTPDGP